MSFVSSFNKIVSCGRLAALQQLEYRFNLLADTVIQPTIFGLIEITLWIAFFQSSHSSTLMGFTQDYYLSYAFWAAFTARISTSWMYEALMIEEIETGTINAILTRPISFFEYYLGQLIGYKTLTTSISFVPPIIICFFMDLPIHLERLPLAILLVFYYLILVHIISMIISSLAFFFTRINHLTTVKNVVLWMLTGELFPLDIAPEPVRSILINLPFSSAVFRPVGYMTGRLPTSAIFEGFVSVSLSILAFGCLAVVLWNLGRKNYSGTGA